MRYYFYTITTWITNKITGLNNNCMRLGDLPVWLKVNHDVTLWFNIMCILVVALIVICIVDSIVTLYHTHKEKNGIKEE